MCRGREKVRNHHLNITKFNKAPPLTMFTKIQQIVTHDCGQHACGLYDRLDVLVCTGCDNHA